MKFTIFPLAINKIRDFFFCYRLRKFAIFFFSSDWRNLRFFSWAIDKNHKLFAHDWLMKFAIPEFSVLVSIISVSQLMKFVIFNWYTLTNFVIFFPTRSMKFVIVTCLIKEMHGVFSVTYGQNLWLFLRLIVEIWNSRISGDVGIWGSVGHKLTHCVPRLVHPYVTVFFSEMCYNASNQKCLSKSCFNNYVVQISFFYDVLCPFFMFITYIF